MSIRESFEEFEQHAAELDREESREKLEELHRLIGKALDVARAVRDGGRLDRDASAALREAMSLLIPAHAYAAKACLVEEQTSAQEMSEVA
jgi:hypothetical protein